MTFSDRLKSLDAQSSASKEFREYTLHGAVLSVITILGESSFLSVQKLDLHVVPVFCLTVFLPCSHCVFGCCRICVQL
jgi:hypothetical protein